MKGILKGILAVTTLTPSLFITTNAWTQSGQGPGGAPPGTPPGTLKVYSLGPNEAKQLQNGALNQRPPQDCEALRQATEECQENADAHPGAPHWPCDALANQFVACKTGN